MSEPSNVVRKGDQIANVLRNYDTDDFRRTTYAEEMDDLFRVQLHAFEHQLETVRSHWGSLGDYLSVAERFDDDGIDKFNRLFVVGHAETECLAECLMAAWREELRHLNYNDYFTYDICPVHEQPQWMTGHTADEELNDKKRYPSPSEFGYRYGTCEQCEEDLIRSPRRLIEELLIGPDDEALINHVVTVNIQDGKATADVLIDREHMAKNSKTTLRRIDGFFDSIDDEYLTEITREVAEKRHGYTSSSIASDETLHFVRIQMLKEEL